MLASGCAAKLIVDDEQHHHHHLSPSEQGEQSHRASKRFNYQMGRGANPKDTQSASLHPKNKVVKRSKNTHGEEGKNIDNYRNAHQYNILPQMPNTDDSMYQISEMAAGAEAEKAIGTTAQLSTHLPSIKDSSIAMTAVSQTMITV